MDERTITDQGSEKPPEESAFAMLLVLGGLEDRAADVQMVRLDGTLAIGRGENELSSRAWQIDEATVSRRHALVSEEAGRFFLVDAGSRNGTWLNGSVLRSERAPLVNGALILLGGKLAVFRCLSEEELAAVAAEQEHPVGPVPTASPGLALALRRLRILAGTDRPVLLAGETGTGKEVYARAAHELSRRRGPFIALNCASFNRELFESHLFGYKRGSHSLAREDSPGVLESAEGGTLFLDEIGEMEVALQTKLLRFLQDKSFLGVGWTRPRRADVRIIAAAQSPQTTLRMDILGRLGAEPVLLPPLRRRREDLPALSQHFLRRSASGEVRGLERHAAAAFCLYGWPRNVRELEATIAEGALSAAERGSDRIELQDLPLRMRQLLRQETESTDVTEERPPESRPGSRLPRPPRAEVESLLREYRGNVPEVARRLGRRRELIWRWCRLDGIDPNAFKSQDQNAPEEPSTKSDDPN